jgi:hypothetical protein
VKIFSQLNSNSSGKRIFVQKQIQPAQSSEHVRSIATDLVLTVLTCGLFNIYVQYKQMVTVNAMLNEQKYHFTPWLLLSLITCGLYHVYHEYRKSDDIVRVMRQAGHSVSDSEPLLSIVLTSFGLHIIADALQQVQINKFYGDVKL